MQLVIISIYFKRCLVFRHLECYDSSLCFFVWPTMTKTVSINTTDPTPSQHNHSWHISLGIDGTQRRNDYKNERVKQNRIHNLAQDGTANRCVQRLQHRRIIFSQ